MLSTWIKARAWQNPALRYFLGNSGNIPLASRGYIISGDFQQLLGRKPSDEEYRALRDHLDQGAPLPDGEVFERLQNQRRSLFGSPFNPSERSYREALEQSFGAFMESSLIVAERAVQNGHFPQVNPQGSRSSRITRGKPGAIHIVASLKLPILPVSVLGMRSAMPNQGLRSRGGEIVVRCGEPYRPALEGLSDATPSRLHRSR